MSTCAGWSNGKKLASTCVQIWARPKSSQVHASRRKSMQVNTSGWPNETQVERKTKTCVDLRVCLARALSWVNKKIFYSTCVNENYLKKFSQEIMQGFCCVTPRSHKLTTIVYKKEKGFALVLIKTLWAHRTPRKFFRGGYYTFWGLCGTSKQLKTHHI